MAALLTRSAWLDFTDFWKKWYFFAQIVFISDFSLQIRNQRPKIDPSAKFQPIWTKDKNIEFRPRTIVKTLMTSYTRGIDDVTKLFNGFERFCARVSSCQVWWWLDHKYSRNIERRGHNVPPLSLYFTKIPQSAVGLKIWKTIEQWFRVISTVLQQFNIVSRTKQTCSAQKILPSGLNHCLLYFFH